MELRMSFVMVPVPKEHLHEFTQFVMRLTLRDAMNQWAPEDLFRLVETLSPQQLALVEYLSEQCAEGKRPTKLMCATALGTSDDQVVVLLNEVNGRSHELGLMDLILFDQAPQHDDGGEAGPELLAIAKNLAELIVERQADPVD